MGLIKTGALSSSIEADPDLIWPVPEHWTLEDAATVIQPYALAYYLLVSTIQIKASTFCSLYKNLTKFVFSDLQK